jgi:hypothetical protein
VVVWGGGVWRGLPTCLSGVHQRQTLRSWRRRRPGKPSVPTGQHLSERTAVSCNQIRILRLQFLLPRRVHSAARSIRVCTLFENEGGGGYLDPRGSRPPVAGTISSMRSQREPGMTCGEERPASWKFLNSESLKSAHANADWKRRCRRIVKNCVGVARWGTDTIQLRFINNQTIQLTLVFLCNCHHLDVLPDDGMYTPVQKDPHLED